MKDLRHSADEPIARVIGGKANALPFLFYKAGRLA
jgi:hypothetical protein